MDKEGNIVGWGSGKSHSGPSAETQGLCHSDALFLGNGIPNPSPLQHISFLFTPFPQSDSALGPSSVFLPVSSILARLSGWTGTLYGASPLNPSWGHGGGLGS